MRKSKNYIFNNKFLLQSKTAEHLYEDYASQMPIIDYHCHLPVKEIAKKHQFKNMTEIWLQGDHYKWRAQRALGIDEKYITGNASDEEKFQKWAEVVPKTLRNPLFDWTHLELKNPFGVETYLNKENAKEIYEYCNDLLQESKFTANQLLDHFNVKTVCTTDDPIDSLEYHKAIKTSDIQIKVFPAFRPDKALHIQKGKAFIAYIKSLSEAAKTPINNLEDLLGALKSRIDYFDKNGGSLTDHGLSYIPVFDQQNAKKTDETFKKALSGKVLTQEEIDQYTGHVLFELCKIYAQKEWVQQFHLNPLRNTNTKMFDKIGPDTGFDSIGDFKQEPGLSQFLDKLEREDLLAKTILYNLNPRDNELFATMTGNFNTGGIKGKIQYGAAWWYLDQLDGMKKQMDVLSNMGILSNFVGMLTDSRSFLSYSRHEYFRRLLCNMLGEDMEKGLLPNDEKWIGEMIEDICYNNAKDYFQFRK